MHVVKLHKIIFLPFFYTFNKPNRQVSHLPRSSLENKFSKRSSPGRQVTRVMLLFNQMLKMRIFSSKISNLKQFKKDFEKWSNVFKYNFVTISVFFRNVLPFLSVLVFSGMKTGSFRAFTKSVEIEHLLNLTNPSVKC